MAGDTPETLSARVLEAEHKLYPACLKLVAEGKARVSAECVRIAEGSEPDAETVLINPSV